MRVELDEKQDVMRSLQETASRLCQENHPAKQTVEVNSVFFFVLYLVVHHSVLKLQYNLKDFTIEIPDLQHIFTGMCVYIKYI